MGWMFEQEQTEGTETDDFPAPPDLVSDLSFPCLLLFKIRSGHRRSGTLHVGGKRLVVSTVQAGGKCSVISRLGNLRLCRRTGGVRRKPRGSTRVRKAEWPVPLTL